jgi:hypothetical protein
MTPGSHWGKLRLDWVFYDPEDAPLRNELPRAVVAYLLRLVRILRFKADVVPGRRRLKVPARPATKVSETSDTIQA